MPNSPTKSSETTAVLWVQLRAIAASREDAEAVLAEWHQIWGERLRRVREPRCGRENDWLVYADLRLDEPTTRQTL